MTDRSAPPRGRFPSALSQHRTFRWNDGVDVEQYAGVETTDEGLSWFRWSHQQGPSGGRHEIARQTYEAFERDGAPAPIPEHALNALRAWIARMG